MRPSLCALIAFFFMTAHAASIEQPLADPAQEARAREIFHQLKCVVCEGQSLAESDATLAAQMRVLIRSKVAAGETTPQVLDYFRMRYGERILLTPPMEKNTYLLWFTPFLLLSGGGVLVWRITRKGAVA